MAQNYILLERIELNADATTVSFQNIPQTGYTDLKVVISSRGTRATYENGSIGVRFNNDTGSNYNTRSLMARGTSAYSETTGTTTFVYFNTATSTATANTYGNAEIYIPNYTSSNQKSVSMDAVGENNATNSILDLGAGIWTGTSAINRIDFIVGVWDSMTNILSNSTFSLYGIAAVGTTPAVAPKADGGNVIATDGTYWYHAFLSNGTFTPQVGLSCDVLQVAGGGGGGGPYGAGGGGGAGGLLYFASQSLTATGYAVAIGAGGTAGSGSANAVGGSGGNSSFGALTVSVGGGGGANYRANGATGGSGGGGGGGDNPGTSLGGSATSGQGYAGGNGVSGSNQYTAGGGGGAGAVGGNQASSYVAGAGGAGVNTYSAWATATNTGASGYYAGGGGGSAGDGSAANGSGGAGGAGGGGNGGNNNNSGANGTTNTGGGGGGTRNGSTAGAGGSGIIIIRYPVA